MHHLLAVAACLFGPLLATAGSAEGTLKPTGVDLDPVARDTNALVLTISSLTARPWITDSSLQPGTVVVGLHRAAPSSTRQAIAHGLGCWWIEEDDGTLHLTRTATVFPGPLRVRVYSSQVQQPEARNLVPRLLTPWLAGNAVLNGSAADGSWIATLDSSGHRQLIELLTLLERPNIRVPDLIPDPAQPDLTSPLQRAPITSNWPAFAADMVAITGLNIAINAPESLPVPHFSQAPATLAGLASNLDGVQARWLRGVLCIGNKPPEDTEHPAQRRRWATVPIAHLLADAPGVDAHALARELQHRTGSEHWHKPGYALEPIPTINGSQPPGLLLVAADIPLIHATLAILADLDALGYLRWHQKGH